MNYHPILITVCDGCECDVDGIGISVIDPTGCEWAMCHECAEELGAI